MTFRNFTLMPAVLIGMSAAFTATAENQLVEPEEVTATDLVISLPASSEKNESVSKMSEIIRHYTVAYNSMDNKKLAPLLSERLQLTTAEKFHQYRKQRLKPMITATVASEYFRGKNSYCDTLLSLSVNSKVKYRNQPVTFTFSDDIITAISTPLSKNTVNSFWNSVLHADAIAVIKSKGRGKPALTSLLTGKIASKQHITFPPWVIAQTGTDDDYLLPLKKSGNGFTVVGRSYSFPEFTPAGKSQLVTCFTEYKTLAPEQEAAFMMKLITDPVYSGLQTVTLRRLITLGIFKKRLNNQQLALWENLLFPDTVAADSTTGGNSTFRRQILTALGKYNFSSDSPLFLKALQDKKLSSLTASLYRKNTPQQLAALLTKWLDDPKLRPFALRNAGLLQNNPQFIAKAMSYFNPDDTKPLNLYISVLLAPKNKTGHDFIINFLKTDKNKTHFRIHAMIIMIIARHPDAAQYAAAIRLFMINNKINPRHFIYPVALAIRCKAKEPQALKAAIEYIDKNAEKRHLQYLFVAQFPAYRRFKNIQSLRKSLSDELKLIENKQSKTITEHKQGVKLK